MRDELITLESVILTDAPSVADEFRRRNLGSLYQKSSSEGLADAKEGPSRFYGWRSGLALHDLFNRLSVERDGALIGENDLFCVSYAELQEMGKKCRTVLDAYKVSRCEGDRASEALVPPPLTITVLQSGYRYDLFDYQNEIERSARLSEILSGIPRADEAKYYYSWFSWA